VSWATWLVAFSSRPDGFSAIAAIALRFSASRFFC